MPTTAARTTPDLSRRYLATLEHRDEEFDELVYSENEILWFFSMAAERKTVTGGIDVIKAMTGDKNDSFQAFAGTDTLSIPTHSGPVGARWVMRNFKVSVQLIWEEMISNSGAVQEVDLFQEMHDNAVLAFAEGMQTVFKEGQGANAKYFEGLEEAVIAVDHDSGSPHDGFTRAQATGSATAYNTYAGIDRRQTDDAAVGWRNLSAAVGATALGGATPLFTDGLNSNMYKAFKRFIRICSRGSRKTDVVLMSLTPYEHFEYLAENAVRFQKTGAPGDAQIPFDNLMFRDALVLQVMDLEHSGNTGEADAGDDVIYALRSADWDICVESQADYAWTEPLDAGPTKLAKAMHNLARMTLRCKSPRHQGVMHDYGDA